MDEYGDLLRQRLARIRDERCGGNAAELARRIKKDPTYVNRLFYPPDKKGAKGIGLEIMSACTEAFGLPPGYWDGAEITWLPEEKPVDNIVAINHYATGGSMGTGLVLKDQPGIIQSMKVSREWVDKNVPYFTRLENLAIVTGFGDSMLGMFNPGDPLLVDRGITKADVDGVYFFRVGDEGFIKRLQRIPGEGIVVISENSKYRDWTIKPDMDFEVMAKVLRAWNGQHL